MRAPPKPRFRTGTSGKYFAMVSQRLRVELPTKRTEPGFGGWALSEASKAAIWSAKGSWGLAGVGVALVVFGGVVEVVLGAGLADEAVGEGEGDEEGEGEVS